MLFFKYLMLFLRQSALENTSRVMKRKVLDISLSSLSLKLPVPTSQAPPIPQMQLYKS